MSLQHLRRHRNDTSSANWLILSWCYLNSLVTYIFTPPTSAQWSFLSYIFNVNEVHHFVDVLPDRRVHMSFASLLGLLISLVGVVRYASDNSRRRYQSQPITHYNKTSIDNQLTWLSSKRIGDKSQNSTFFIN